MVAHPRVVVGLREVAKTGIREDHHHDIVSRQTFPARLQPLDCTGHGHPAGLADKHPFLAGQSTGVHHRLPTGDLDVIVHEIEIHVLGEDVLSHPLGEGGIDFLVVELPGKEVLVVD